MKLTASILKVANFSRSVLLSFLFTFAFAFAFAPLLFITVSAQAADPVQTDQQIIELSVNERGFFPNIIQADPGKPVVLKITRVTKDTCATSISLPAQKIKRKLPLNKTVTILVGPLERGEVKFGCVSSLNEGGIIYVK